MKLVNFVDEKLIRKLSIGVFFLPGFDFNTIYESHDCRKGVGLSSTPHYNFHLLHIHLDIGNSWFPSASR